MARKLHVVTGGRVHAGPSIYIEGVHAVVGDVDLRAQDLRATSRVRVHAVARPRGRALIFPFSLPPSLTWIMIEELFWTCRREVPRRAAGSRGTESPRRCRRRWRP